MPEQILLTDNTEYPLNQLGMGEPKDIGSLLDSLHKIADVNISELKNDTNFLLFSNRDKIEDQRIFTIQYDPPNKAYSISTGNIAGFIGIDDVQLSVHSRFAKGQNDFFLHYMLSKVFSINMVDLEHGKKQGELFDFLIFLFPFFLRNALKKGIVHSYVKHEYDDTNVKGPINVQRFLKRDVPFQGKISYDKREYSVDNNLTELARHTIEYIKSGTYASIIRNGDVASDVRKIIEATPSYDKSKRESVINRNLRPIRHPYYSEWTDLQKICLMILRHKKINYAESKDKIYGIVFDVAWLWEEYLNTLLSNMGFIHPRNKDGEGKIFLFSGRKGERYPDFYNDQMVLDAKYKRFEWKNGVSQIGRDDLHQMISYLHVLYSTPREGLFIYPSETTEGCSLDSEKLNGLGGIIGARGIHIPQTVSSFSEFVKEMGLSERAFLETFNV